MQKVYSIIHDSHRDITPVDFAPRAETYFGCGYALHGYCRVMTWKDISQGHALDGWGYDVE